ncbi:hypothetical protein OH687_24620 [Burkholderia anthina]|nr:hypothetical protein OH687_24620 [Burkholderia anthina]
MPERDARCAAAPPDDGGRTDPPARGQLARTAKTFSIVDGFLKFRLRPDGRLRQRKDRPDGQSTPADAPAGL